MTYTPATLTGKFEKPDGTPAVGYVKIIPNSVAIIDQAGNLVLAGPLTIPLDDEGAFTVELPPTDDIALEPANDRQYTISVRLHHTNRLPTLTGIELDAGTTSDWADLVSGVEATATISTWLTEAEYDALVARVTDLEDNPVGAADWADLTGKPTFATVATSGAYTDLTAKPTIPDSADDIGAEAIGVAAGLIAAHIAATDPHGDRAYTDTQINALINGAPGLLNTLGEIAAQLATDESAVGALTTAVNARLVAANNLSDLANAATARTNLGLGNVTNTSDANKPVSTAQQAAIDALGTVYGALGGSPPPSVTTPPANDQTMWVQNFSGGAVTGAASSNLSDTSDVLLGSQSATVTTDGSQTLANLSVTGLTAVDFTGRYLKAWLKVSDPVKLASVKVILGTGGFANTYSLAAQQSSSAGTSGLQVLQADVWTPVTLGWAEALTTGSPNRTSIDSLRIQVKDSGSGNAVTVKIAGVAYLPEPSAAFPNGVVTLCFDDGYISQYTTARPYLDKYAMPATAMPIVDLIDSGASWLTTTQLRELQDKHGWEVAGHAATQAHHDNRLTSLSTATLKAEFATNRAWLQANGFRGGDITAYPGGIYNPAVKQTAQSYWASARGVVSNTHETFPPGDQYMIRAYPCDNTTGGPTLANIETAIDNAYANRGWLVLVLHDIQASPTANSIQWSTANFQALIDYIAAKGIPVRTYGDVLREKRIGAPTGRLSTLTDVSLGTLTDGDVIHYDSTSAKWKNAQPTGSSGTVTKADTLWTPEDSGYISWTEDPKACNATIIGSGGILYFQKHKIRQTCTITKIIRYLQTAGAGLTTALDGLYDATGVLLGSTGSMVSAWQSGAGTFVTGTLSSSVTITVTGAPVYVYTAHLTAGTTQPTFIRGQNILNATTTNAGLTAAGGFRFGQYGSGLTALPTPLPLASTTSQANPTLAILSA